MYTLLNVPYAYIRDIVTNLRSWMNMDHHTPSTKHPLRKARVFSGLFFSFSLFLAYCQSWTLRLTVLLSFECSSINIFSDVSVFRLIVPLFLCLVRSAFGEINAAGLLSFGDRVVCIFVDNVVDGNSWPTTWLLSWIQDSGWLFSTVSSLRSLSVTADTLKSLSLKISRGKY